jgi:hypothetical protein
MNNTKTTSDSVFGLILDDLHTGGTGCQSLYGDCGTCVGRFGESDFMTMKIEGSRRIVLWDQSDAGLVRTAVYHGYPVVRLVRDFAGQVVDVEPIDIDMACDVTGVNRRVPAVQSLI